MRKELETIALIENYLSGKLSPEEQLQFEAEMAVNDELREETELQRDLVGAILLAAFAEDVRHVHSELVAKPSKTLGKLIWYSLSGIALVVGLTSAMVWWNKQEKPQVLKSGKTEIAGTVSSAQPSTVNQRNSNTEKKPTTPAGKKAAHPSRKSRSASSGQQPVAFDTDQHRATANLQNFQPSFRNVTMNPNEDFTFKMTESQSPVFIPANSIRHSSGKTVTGPVEIRYREYRDAADIAFSKIPMTVHENGEELAFNSAGMFEIYAYQNGERLSLDPEKPMIVDYNVTQRLDDLYFWQLKDGRWAKLRAIDNSSYGRPAIAENIASVTPGAKYSKTITEMGKIKLNIKKTFGDKAPKNIQVKHKEGMKWVRVQNLQKTDSGYVFDASPGHDYKVYAKGTKTLKISSINCERGKMSALNVWLQPRRRNGVAGKIERKTESAARKIFMKFKGHYKTDTVYALPVRIVNDSTKDSIVYTSSPTSTKSAQQYSNLVGGLQCSNFGVYNCDQTYRIAGKVQIRGKFKDENGKAIDSPGMLSVVAAGVNGAIAYSPGYFACSKAGTTLLLFTDDSQIYALSKEEFGALDIRKDGEYTFQVRNMTSELRDSNDLRRYLKLK